MLSRTQLLACLLGLLASLLVACDGGDKPASTAATTTTSGATATPADSKPSVEPSPTPGSAQANDEPVSFATEDGATLKGHFYGVAGPKRRVVVFAHMNNRDQSSWQNFARELAASGTATMTFDFRGFGESAGPKDQAKADRDLDAAVRFVRSRDYPLLYVVGASLGGTAAIKVAARQELAGVVCVSAPAEVLGLDARPDVSKITERKLFVASRGEGGAPEDVAYFMENTPEPKESHLFDGSAHGSDLLTSPHAAAFKQLLIDFLTK